MSFAADDFEAIRRRQDEIRAELDIALKGTSAPNDGQETKSEDQPQGYGYGGLYYTVGQTHGTASTSGAHTTRVTIDPSAMSSLAHPEWPYAGTGFEWRKFVRS